MEDNIEVGKRLQSIVDRIERLTEEKQGLADDIKNIYTQAKGEGLDPKIIRQCIKIRKKAREQYEEEQMLLDVYLQALGQGTQ